MAFFDIPVSSVVDQHRSGARSIRETVERSLRNIEEKNPRINAFITVTAKEALERVEYLESLSDVERASMPLYGIPVGVKDNICTKGIKTTCASKMLENFIPPYNAHVVERLLEAGAVIIGKTNQDEFAMGSSNENSFFGSVLNPVDESRVPGGSSGGSAAAVAADMVPLSLGSDTGGSIRQPASHCGVVGMKPTYGMVSRYGLVAFASSLDQIGPFASSSEDAALLLQVISGKDGRDSTNAGRDFQYEDGEILKVGLPDEYFGEGLTDEVRALIDDLCKKMEKRGVEFVPVSLPNVASAIATYYVIATAEASSNLARFDGVKYGYRSENCSSLKDMYAHTRSEAFGKEVRRRILLGTYVLSSGYYDAYYLKAAKVRTLIKNDFINAFNSCDIILSPVAPAPAFKIGEKTSDPMQMYLTDIYTVSANLAGIPGISVPAGSVEGLPVGVQFMAPEWGDAKLFQASKMVEGLSVS